MQSFNEDYLCSSDFSQMLMDLEEMRKKEHKNYVLMSILYFIVCPILLSALIFYICLLIDKSLVLLPCLIFLSPLALIFLISLFAYYRYLRNKKFVLAAKNEKLREFISIIGKIKWRGHDIDKTLYNSLIPDTDLRQSGLFLDYNIRNLDDEFDGIFKDVKFTISETILKEKIRTSKGDTIIPVFKGIVIKFKSNKEIKNRTIVSTKGNLTARSQFFISILVMTIPLLCTFADNISLIFKIFLVAVTVFTVGYCYKCSQKDENKLDKVTLEDTEFMKRFNVYSSDQVEARYLITPAFMQRFNNLKTAFGAKVIKCSFYNDNLMIAITTSKNLFEIGSLYKPFKGEHMFKKFYSELDSVLQMVEYFKLNEKTGL